MNSEVGLRTMQGPSVELTLLVCTWPVSIDAAYNMMWWAFVLFCLCSEPFPLRPNSEESRLLRLPIVRHAAIMLTAGPLRFDTFFSQMLPLHFLLPLARDVDTIRHAEQLNSDSGFGVGACDNSASQSSAPPNVANGGYVGNRRESVEL
jgi:hypothetical protein